MQFFFSPLLDVVSDRYGRRPVILISCFGLGLDYILTALAPSLTLLFVGRVISGITSATIGTGFAYIAGVPTMALWGLSGPAIMGLMSRLVSPSEQGQLRDANTSLSSVAGLIGPGIFAVTFSGLLERLPSAAFDLSAVILLGALAVAWAVTRRRPDYAPPR